jgi:hypothetical protein
VARIWTARGPAGRGGRGLSCCPVAEPAAAAAGAAWARRRGSGIPRAGAHQLMGAHGGGGQGAPGPGDEQDQASAPGPGTRTRPQPHPRLRRHPSIEIAGRAGGRLPPRPHSSPGAALQSCANAASLVHEAGAAGAGAGCRRSPTHTRRRRPALRALRSAPRAPPRLAEHQQGRGGRRERRPRTGGAGGAPGARTALVHVQRCPQPSTPQGPATSWARATPPTASARTLRPPSKPLTPPWPLPPRPSPPGRATSWARATRRTATRAAGASPRWWSPSAWVSFQGRAGGTAPSQHARLESRVHPHRPAPALVLLVPARRRP